MWRKNDVSTLRYARSFERLQLRTSGFKTNIISNNLCFGEPYVVMLGWFLGTGRAIVVTPALASALAWLKMFLVKVFMSLYLLKL